MNVVQPNSHSSASTFGAGIGWLLAGRVGFIVTTLVTVPVLARLLTPTEFGIMAAITVVQSLGNAIAEGGFAAPIVQREQLSISSRNGIFFLTGGIGLLLAIGIGVAAPLIESLFAIKGLATPLIIVMLALPISGATLALEAIMVREHKYRHLTIARHASYCIGYAIPAVALAWYGFGVWALVIPTLTAAILELSYALWVVGKPTHLTLRIDDDEMIKSGITMTLTNILNWAALSTPNILVGRMVGVDGLGLYSRAGKIYSLATQLSVDTVMPVFFSGMSSLRTKEEGDIAFKRTLSVLLPFYLTLAAFLIIHAEAIVHLMLGSQWLSIIPVVQILFAAFAGRCGYKIAEVFALSKGKFKSAAVRQAIYLVAVVVGCGVGSIFGLTGVASGFALAIWLFYIISMSWSTRLASITWRELGLIHLRSILLVIPAAYIDVLVDASLDQHHWLWAQIAGAGSGLATFIAIVLFAPVMLLGQDLAWIRERVWKAAKAYVSPPDHSEHPT